MNADQNCVRLCKSIAEEAHAGQLDKQGIPYIEHVRGVVDNLVNFKCSDDQICAAWLHDVVEDTDTTLNDLYDKTVNGYVVYLVDVLTRRKYYSYQDYIIDIGKHPEVVPIKLADIKHNLSRGPMPDRDRQARLMARYLKAQKYLSNILSNYNEYVNG